ncbi:MAG: hypothetical protein CO094_10485 [Anaerolineae bacterium CG_4_9_14_3_um_filter_57_17]|nr:c-type cytochrome [bacterium]NCT20860.1 c-type cytochrome [bacterium]OIO84427.1 MAG: hypothetical protein AUK01_09415 [Anaerolineae bacterium CG2_30_57_67]PJB65231.1 MAG: hypothetical protein CO094_10485 [Anaerolineae bacterium CG_4_9_14_3_um_filter_57_17]
MKTRFLVFFVLLTLALAGCTLAEDITPPPGYISPTPPPVIGPLYPQTAPDLANGAAIFAEKCAPCHGATGLGDGPKASQLPVTVPTLGLSAIAQGAIPADWYTVVTQGRMDKMMPPFTSLNDQERWNVVAYALSISVKAENIALGKQVFAKVCAECHGPDGAGVANANLADPALVSKLSKNDIFRFVSKGIAPGMPGTELTLDEASRRAVADYVISWNFGAPVTLAAVATPTLAPATATSAPLETATQAAAEATPIAGASSTLEASPTATTASGLGVDVTPGVETPPAVLPTVEVTPAASPTPANPQISITGTVTNASGAALPANFKVTLHGFDHAATNGQFTEAVTLEATVKSDGSFAFTGVDAPVGRAFSVTTVYDGNQYTSEVVFAEAGKQMLEMPLTVYGTTTDTSALVADQLHLLLDFSTPDVVTVIEFYVVSNSGEKAVVAASEGGAVTQFVLPSGYSNLQFQEGALGDRYLQTEQGFADTLRIAPGSQSYQLAYAFDLPYVKSNVISAPGVKFDQTFTLPVSIFSVLAEPGIQVTGEGLTDGGIQDMGGTKFQVYKADGFSVGKTLKITVSGAPAASAGQTQGADSTQGILIGVAVLGIVLIAAGAYLFWRDRRRQLEEESPLTEDQQSEDEILDAIIALEDQFKAGNISEEAYRARREELKAKLKAL